MTTGAEHGEIAEVGSPVNLPPAPVDHRAPWRWTTASIAVAALLLALGNGPAMSAWVDDLPPGQLASALHAPVYSWSAFTARWSLDRPSHWLRSQWLQARKARLGREDPGDAGTADAPSSN